MDLKEYQYKRMLEERRGHSYQYPTNEQQIKNDSLGYVHHEFVDRKGFKSMETRNEETAKEIVINYRCKGFFSRIVCYPNNIIGARYFSVIYRKKP
jgi:hypothetical protein